MEDKNNSNKSGFAIASLICSLVGLLMFGLVLGTIGIIFGGLSWEKPMGKVGLIIGVFDVIAVLAFISTI